MADEQTTQQDAPEQAEKSSIWQQGYDFAKSEDDAAKMTPEQFTTFMDTTYPAHADQEEFISGVHAWVVDEFCANCKKTLTKIPRMVAAQMMSEISARMMVTELLSGVAEKVAEELKSQFN